MHRGFEEYRDRYAHVGMARRAVQDHLSHGIALEGLAMLDGSAPT